MTYLKSEGEESVKEGVMDEKRVPSNMIFVGERDDRQSFGSEGVYLKSEGEESVKEAVMRWKRVPSNMIFFGERDDKQSFGSEGVFKVVKTRFWSK